MKSQIILTKNDAVTPNELAKRLMLTSEEVKRFKNCVEPILLASSKTKSGIVELKRIIASFVDKDLLQKLRKSVEKETQIALEPSVKTSKKEKTKPKPTKKKKATTVKKK